MNRMFILMLGAYLLLANNCSKDNEPVSIGRTSAVFNDDLSYGTLTDQDNNTYRTITIGTQTWMAENLRTTKYNDGTVIPNLASNSDWSETTAGAYCNYNNNSNEDSIATYGRIYNWKAVNTGRLAPVGWHVPTDADWRTLVNYLGGESVAGGKLKESGTTHWLIPNTGANNSSGFTALPGGTRCFWGSDSLFTARNWGCIYWGSNYLNGSVWVKMLVYDHGNAYDHAVNTFNDNYGFSVRCVKD